MTKLPNLTRDGDKETVELLIELLDYRDKLKRIRRELFSQNALFDKEGVDGKELMDWLEKQENFTVLQIKNIVVDNNEDEWSIKG